MCGILHLPENCSALLSNAPRKSMVKFYPVSPACLILPFSFSLPLFLLPLPLPLRDCGGIRKRGMEGGSNVQGRAPLPPPPSPLSRPREEGDGGCLDGKWAEEAKEDGRAGGRSGGDGRSLLLSGRVEFMHPLSLVPFSSSPFSLDFWGSNTWRG